MFFRIFILICTVLIALGIPAQEYPDVYPVTSGELIFSNADVQINDVSQNTSFRFSFFFHYGQYWHVDFTNNFGFFSGVAIRNVGFITKGEGNYDKIKRRSYSLGLPVVFKLGSFKDHFFLYGGGEYEWMFHYKQKFFDDNGKQKSSEWFSNRTNQFIPSLVGGIQFPKGLNLRFKYYLDNFLNPNYFGSDFGTTVDYSVYETRMYYISISFDFKTEKILKKTKDPVLAGL